jgi:OmpA-OmpF porin, OOP family
MKLSTQMTAAASLAASLLLSCVASAQASGGFAMNQLEPTPAGDSFFGVPSPRAGGHLIPRAAVMFDYANQPVRYVSAGGTIPVVAQQGFLRVDASLPLWDRLLISADVPAAILQSGEDPKLEGITFPPPSAGFGDLRLGLRGRLFGGDRSLLQLGLGSYLFFPTGRASSYTGDGVVRGALHAIVGGRAESSIGLVWSATGGVSFHGGGSPHVLTFGAGAALLFGGGFLQVGPELYGGKPLGERLTLSTTGKPVEPLANTNMELLIGAKIRLLGRLVVGAGAGPGLLTGIGTPNFRFVGTVAWAPEAAPTPTLAPNAAMVGDQDNDGIRDDIDACPTIKGELQSDPTKDGCPVADRDQDGVADIEDACPGVPGLRSPDGTKSGCPKDSDEDGVPDTEDACLNDRGVASRDPKQNGCPSDRDGDGVADAVDACPEIKGVKSVDAKWNGCTEDPDGDGIKQSADACPNEKGAPDRDPKQNGCPKLVRVVGDEIVIKSQVQFQVYGKHRSETVAPVSQNLMNEIRDVINQHPEILKIEVQGHTDDSGDDDFNLRLSQDRAEAVRQWLIDAGIPASKLVAKGYGFNKPLADNRIRQGRQQNRRVEFVVLEKKK